LTPRARGAWRPPPVPSTGVLQEVAQQFCPPYEIADTERKRPGVRLRDPTGRRPDVLVRHRYEKRLFLRANYLSLSATVAGAGPVGAVDLAVRLRGPLSRQRATVHRKEQGADGRDWFERLRDPLLEAANSVEAVQSLSATWSPKRREWSVRLETMSGSMVSGMMAGLPIAVPFEPKEASAFIGLVDAFVEAAAVPPA
jgi:hypothetical protein